MMDSMLMSYTLRERKLRETMSSSASDQERCAPVITGRVVLNLVGTWCVIISGNCSIPILFLFSDLDPDLHRLNGQGH